MKIILKSKNLEITQSVEDYLQKKLDSLEKFVKDFNQELLIADIEVGRTTFHRKSGDVFRAEINLSLGGELLRAEAESDDLFAAIDEVRDDLELKIKKFKTKKETIFKRGARSIKKHFSISPLARFRKGK